MLRSLRGPPVRREPLFLFKKKEGGKKTPEGERGRFPLRTSSSVHPRLRLPSGKSTQFTTRLTRYLIGKRHCLWHNRPLQSQRLKPSPSGRTFEGVPGEASPGPFFPTAFLRKRKRCPRRAGGSLQIGVLYTSPGNQKESRPSGRLPIFLFLVQLEHSHKGLGG